jgi:PKD repeat protein
MRKSILIPIILMTVGTVVSGLSSYGQQRTVAGTVHYPQHKPQELTRDNLKQSLLKTSRSSALKKTGKNDPDTLNYPLPGEYALYISDGGGYVSGNNEYDDLAKANYFSVDQPHYLTGLLIDFGVATGGSIQIEIAVWDNSGTGAKPGVKLGSEMIDLQSIISDIQNETTTYISFDPPINLTSVFYAGVVLPSGLGDTIAILTNSDGDTSPATAWEQWNDQSWHSFDDPSGWALDVSHAIFPIVVQGELLDAAFTASVTYVQPGGLIQFTDMSLGDPESWEWTFEGGNPGTSNMQNPEVEYLEEGVYTVSLSVTKGTETSTKTIANYITVAEVTPPVIDTLNFPLPGSYTLFILNENGGYVNGNNAYNDLAKANYFLFSEEAKITGLLFDFAIASGGNPSIELAIWNNSGNTGSPGIKIAQTTVQLNEIKTDILNQAMTYVPFNPPVDISQPFYAGFYLPMAAGDTLVVWGNDDGDTNPGTAWELWEDNTWNAFSSPASWQLNIALGIHPIVEYVTGISDQPAGNSVGLSPNPGNGLFWLNVPEHISETMVAQVFSLEGKLVFESVTDFQNGLAMLDMRHLKPGLYFLKGIGREMVFSVKIVIQ